MRAPTLLVLALTAITLCSRIVHADLLDHITYETSTGAVLRGTSGEVLELGIDLTLKVNWDREAFLVDLARRERAVESGDSLLPTIEGLKTTVRLLFNAQQKLLALRATTVRLRRDLAPGASLSDQPAFRQANNEFVRVGAEAMDSLLALKPRAPELYQRLKKPVLEADYTTTATVVVEQVRRLGDELLRRLQNGDKVEVYMLASIRGSDGQSRRVHLENYDTIVAGEPAPFPRFETSVGPRTVGELQAAEGLANLVKGLAQGTVQGEVSQALDDLRAAVKALAAALQTDILGAQLDSLTAEVRAAGDDTLLPLLVDLREVRDWVVSLGRTPQLEGGTDTQRLVMLATALNQNLSLLAHVNSDLPARLDALAARLDTLGTKRTLAVQAQLIQSFRTAAKRFRDSTESVTKLRTKYDELAKALGFTSSVSEATVSAVNRARELAPGQTLDTQLDLMTAGSRHPGDGLTITVRVVREQAGSMDQTVVAERRQAFRLEEYGLYLEPRGALVLADPRSGPHGAQSFEAAPGLAFYWRWGWRGHPTWNRALALGVGPSFTLLDFVDNKDLELGVAASATALWNLVWVGYGRNLQARMDYFYLGINPAVLVGLSRGALGRP